MRKGVALDETHFLSQVPTGKVLIDRLARDSRKFNVRALFASQLAGDLLRVSGFASLVNAVFVGRTDDERGADRGAAAAAGAHRGGLRADARHAVPAARGTTTGPTTPRASSSSPTATAASRRSGSTSRGRTWSTSGRRWTPTRTPTGCGRRRPLPVAPAPAVRGRAATSAARRAAPAADRRARVELERDPDLDDGLHRPRRPGRPAAGRRRTPGAVAAPPGAARDDADLLADDELELLDIAEHAAPTTSRPRATRRLPPTDRRPESTASPRHAEAPRCGGRRRPFGDPRGAACSRSGGCRSPWWWPQPCRWRARAVAGPARRTDRRRPRQRRLAAVLVVVGAGRRLGAARAAGRSPSRSPARSRRSRTGPGPGWSARWTRPTYGVGEPGSVYDEVGYAGLVWHNYDLGCAGTAVFNPATTTDTWLGNQTLNVAKFVVGGVNWSHYLIADGGKLLSPLDKVITDGTRAMYDAVFTTWIGPALLILAVILLVLALRGRPGPADAARRAGAWSRSSSAPRPTWRPSTGPRRATTCCSTGSPRCRRASSARSASATGTPCPPCSSTRSSTRTGCAASSARPDVPQAQELGRDLLRAQTFTKAEIAERPRHHGAGRAEEGRRSPRSATGWATATPTSRASPAAGSAPACWPWCRPRASRCSSCCPRCWCWWRCWCCGCW